MAKRRKSERERVAQPISGAGLITFYQEEIKGIKIKPIYVVVTAILLLSLVMLAHIGFFTP